MIANARFAPATARATALARAKRRAVLRRTRGGAAMFVVAMTIAVLASVGVFALAAAASEVKTSGNERQASQTHFLAQYGVLGAAHELTGSRAQWFIGAMLSATDTCASLPLPTSVPITDAFSRACRRLGSTELSQIGSWSGAVTTPYTGSAPLSGAVTPGSMGPTPMTGDFFVELTAPLQSVPPHGYAMALNFCFTQVTVTANGLTEPFGLGGSNIAFGGEGIEVQRARVVAGPIMCPK